MNLEKKLQKGFREYEKEHSKYLEWLEVTREKNDEYFASQGRSLRKYH